MTVSPQATEVQQERSMRLVGKQFELAPIEGASRRASHSSVAIVASAATRTFADELSRYLPGSEVIEPGTAEINLELKCTMKRHQKDYSAVVDVTGCAEEIEASLHIIPWLQGVIEERQEGVVLLGITQGLETCGVVKRPVSLAGAATAGLYRMLQSEYSHVSSRHMDLDPADDMETLAKQIGDELQLESEEAEVCYRDGFRYRASLQEFRAKSSRTFEFPSEQVVWITGGTRGVGALCARHLVEHYGVRKLVLTGRERLPSREQWEEYEHLDSGTSQKIRHIRDLEALGAQVQVLSLTLSDEQAVRESVETVIKTMGPIGGVIHSAGLTDMDSPAFIRKQPEGIRRVLEPKVEGVNILCQALQEQPLRFFVLFSSVSSIIPSLASGQSDYAMANGYMDYAATAHAERYPMLSVQWPSWKETGFGEVKSRVYHQTGLLSHTNEEGLAMLDMVLTYNVGNVVLPA
ncbi:SDR family NAD(P)-dependent oxidoreductase, partial [Paenibacillus sp. NPDC056933]|uniref:SDR family NAD(P)-dependent oxidoreductase n=1 Tax=Paenibacillus sp. NPDC056933 TaxID=3345968 RepID=UPI003630319F